jgi:hypothetical protein
VPPVFELVHKARALAAQAARLARRPARDQALVAEAAITLLGIRVLLRFFPFERWRALLGARPEARMQPAPRQTSRQIVWAVQRVSPRLPLSLACLARALAVGQMLGRRHLASQLRIGVLRDEQGEFRAHAWVECDGEVIIGDLPNLADYSPLPTWPSRL